MPGMDYIGPHCDKVLEVIRQSGVDESGVKARKVKGRKQDRIEITGDSHVLDDLRTHLMMRFKDMKEEKGSKRTAQEVLNALDTMKKRRKKGEARP